MAAAFDGSEPRDVVFPLLVEEHGGRLLALGLRFCGDRQEAEDLVQETFLEAYLGWEKFEGRASVATWLYTIAAHACQRMHRKRAGEPDSLESLEELLPFGEPLMAVVPSDDDGPEAEGILAESLERVEQAIAELPIQLRMPLVLREVVGLPLADTGTVLGLPAATVKTRLHRARLLVRNALEEVLPRREVPPPNFSRQVCLDLLQAKQESLDRGAQLELSEQLVCERCGELFATLDLTVELCRKAAHGELPDELRQRLLLRTLVSR